MIQNQTGNTQERVLMKALLRDLIRHRGQLASDDDRAEIDTPLRPSRTEPSMSRGSSISL